MQKRDLELTLGLLDLQSDDSLCLLSNGTSPLSLISPNAVLTGSASRASKKAGGAAGFAAADSPAPGAARDEPENEPLGELPQFGARRNASRRAGSRRQSLAIGAMFAGLSTGTGLLGETELSVGDEEVQVPLARSTKLLGGAANHSSLFVDPDTGDLLDTELPSPLMDGGSTPAGGFAAAGGGAPWFASPVPSPTLTASPKTRRNSGAQKCPATWRACWWHQLPPSCRLRRQRVAPSLSLPMCSCACRRCGARVGRCVGGAGAGRL